MTTTKYLPLSRICPGKHRPISEEKVKGLVQSINQVGLLQPLVVTTAGRLIAGRHRLEALRRLGWKTAPCVVLSVDDMHQELASLDENLVRNDLTRLERFEHLARRMEILDAVGLRRKAGRHSNPDTVSGLKTTDILAGESGLSGRTLQRATRIVQDIPEEVRTLLRDTEVADSTTELLRLSRLPRQEQRAVARILAEGECRRVSHAQTQARRQASRRKAKEQARKHKDDGNQHVIVGDFRRVLATRLKDGEATLFLCDPPYTAIDQYGEMARLAARKLCPGGWFVTYAGAMKLPGVIGALGEHLEYWWCAAIKFVGFFQEVPSRRVRAGWKPVLIYRRPPFTQPTAWLHDCVRGAGKDKDHHEWGQPVEEAEYLIECLTNPGDLVVSPTCGAGSELVAAKKLGRRWLGVEIDPAVAVVARMRLREV